MRERHRASWRATLHRCAAAAQKGFPATNSDPHLARAAACGAPQFAQKGFGESEQMPQPRFDPRALVLGGDVLARSAVSAYEQSGDEDGVL